MKRKIYDKMLRWKQNGGNSALMLNGARRVGKSYIAELFARNEYESFILLDFGSAAPEVTDLFVHYLNDLDTFFMYLSAIYNVELIPRKSVIILDEIQLFPKARAALKYLVKDGRYDYIETGSLLSIKANVRDIVIPSEEEQLNIYPMDFEEFLWAMGNETLIPLIRDCFEKKRPLGQAMHRKATDYFRQYMIVGGMPQPVVEYAETRDFVKTDQVKRRILTLYRDDISKFAAGSEAKVTAIFDDIPAQLNRHERKFRLSSINKEARFRQYEDALFWLSDSMIANICFGATAPDIGLRMNMQRTTLKCYMADTGLLISHSFDESSIMSEEIHKKLLLGKLEVNEGMFAENIVAQMLAAAGHKLYFYSKASSTDKSERMEIDFLTAKSKITARHNICPIEVKSGKRYTLTSLRKFMVKYKAQLDTAYVLHSADIKEENGIVYLPLYMATLL